MEVVLVAQSQTVLHLPLFYRWVGQGDWCSSDFFSALLNKGVNTPNKKNRLCLWQSRESNSIDICAVHAKRALLPSKP